MSTLNVAIKHFVQQVIPLMMPVNHLANLIIAKSTPAACWVCASRNKWKTPALFGAFFIILIGDSDLLDWSTWQLFLLAPPIISQQKQNESHLGNSWTVHIPSFYEHASTPFHKQHIHTHVFFIKNLAHRISVCCLTGDVYNLHAASRLIITITARNTGFYCFRATVLHTN